MRCRSPCRSAKAMAASGTRSASSPMSNQREPDHAAWARGTMVSASRVAAAAHASTRPRTLGNSRLTATASAGPAKMENSATKRMRKAPRKASAAKGTKIRRGASGRVFRKTSDPNSVVARPNSKKKKGPSSGQRAVRYSCKGRSHGMRMWLAM